MIDNINRTRHRRNARTASIWTLIAGGQLLLLIFTPEATASFPGQSTLPWKWLAFVLTAATAAMYWFQFAHASQRPSPSDSDQLEGDQR